jgi:hypothetical protein
MVDYVIYIMLNCVLLVFFARIASTAHTHFNAILVRCIQWSKAKKELIIGGKFKGGQQVRYGKVRVSESSKQPIRNGKWANSSIAFIDFRT